MSNIKEFEAGSNANEPRHQHGVSERSLYRRLAEQDGSDGSHNQRIRILEEENSRLKRMVAELSLDKQILEEALSGKW